MSADRRRLLLLGPQSEGVLLLPADAEPLSHVLRGDAADTEHGYGGSAAEAPPPAVASPHGDDAVSGLGVLAQPGAQVSGVAHGLQRHALHPETHTCTFTAAAAESCCRKLHPPLIHSGSDPQARPRSMVLLLMAPVHTAVYVSRGSHAETCVCECVWGGGCRSPAMFRTACSPEEHCLFTVKTGTVSGKPLKGGRDGSSRVIGQQKKAGSCVALRRLQRLRLHDQYSF